ncbi:MAG: nucleotide sugar dehydrogenase [Verrucomicrobiota bacterium]
MKIGFVGLSHLGINYSLATAAKGFNVVAYQPDKKLCAEMCKGKFPIEEPGLEELFLEHGKRMEFVENLKEISECPLVFVALDVKTDDSNHSDLEPLKNLIDEITPHLQKNSTLVILSQVTPGFMRKLVQTLRARKDFKAAHVYYQVETLIFGRAVERALHPERYIVGCENPQQEIPKEFHQWHESFQCPVLKMRYESAELAKLSINFFLVSSVSTTNTIAELCEKIGADWSEIAPALRLDARIGPKAYLKPGLGIAGGNLERDLVTFQKLAREHGTDFGIIDAWQRNSTYRRDWVLRELAKRVANFSHPPKLAIWGLAYKEDTHSIKNSAAIDLLKAIPNLEKCVYDPQVKLKEKDFSKTRQVTSALSACEGADILIVMTPWKEFKQIALADALKKMNSRIVLDPHGVFEQKQESGLDYATLGV